MSKTVTAPGYSNHYEGKTEQTSTNESDSAQTLCFDRRINEMTQVCI